MILGYSIYEIAAMFFTYAFLGWCVEVIYCGLGEGHFINRGFLNGPVCPIYGVGGVTVILCLTPISDNVLALFIGSAILTSVLELVTGFALDKLFHARWWDYSDMPFNVGGYICLKFSVYWGLVCIGLMKILHPFVLDVIRIVPHIIGIILLVFFAVVFVTDIIITVVTINKLTKRVELMNDIAKRIHSVSDGIGEKVYDGAVSLKDKGEKLKESENAQKLAERSEKIKERGEKELAELKEKYADLMKENHLLQSRIMQAFPKLKMHGNNEQLSKLKERLKLKRK